MGHLVSTRQYFLKAILKVLYSILIIVPEGSKFSTVRLSETKFYLSGLDLTTLKVRSMISGTVRGSS